MHARILFIATIIAAGTLALLGSGSLVAYASPSPTASPTPGLTLYVDSHGRPQSPFKTTRSTIATPGGPVLYGEPANALGAPVALLSCGATFHGAVNSAAYGSIVQFTVINNTANFLRYTRIAYRMDRSGAYDDAFLFNLKPHEVRSFTLRNDGVMAGGDLPVFHDYPHWMLCGAGPAQEADGTILRFLPEFLK